MKHMNNPYGYKVCYKESGTTQYIRHFKTYTYRQAVRAMKNYQAYPPRSRIDGHRLRNPTWAIIPILKSEVRDGIWRELPFRRAVAELKSMLNLKGVRYESIEFDC